jgi:long-chain acyl-CoA synthetase
MPASVGFVVAFHAIQSAGRVALPLNMTLAPPELAGVLIDSTARLVVASRVMQPIVDGLTATGGLPADLRFVWMEDLQRGEAGPGHGGDGESPPVARPGPRIESDQPAVLLYTSGSTGQPKGVMLSAGNLLADSLGCIELARISPDQRFVGMLPLFHAFGLVGVLLVPNLLGATAYYLPRFHPRQALDLIREQRISVAMAIPSMYGAMLKVAQAAMSEPRQSPQGQLRTELPDFNLPICGGEPLSPTIAAQFEQVFGQPLLEGYGLTEASPVVSLSLPWARKTGTVGLPLPNLRVRIVDPQGKDCPPGEPGEVVVYGPNVMLGYYRKPDETRAVIGPDGGLRTGDLGSLGSDGFLTIRGRIKDLIIVAGENVWPGEVEQVLSAHPKVGQSAVIGLHDGARGEMVAGFVSPANPNDPPDIADLRNFCRARLAACKVPRRLEVLAELPLGPTGKVLKRELRRRAGS